MVIISFIVIYYFFYICMYSSALRFPFRRGFGEMRGLCYTWVALGEWVFIMQKQGWILGKS